MESINLEKENIPGAQLFHMGSPVAPCCRERELLIYIPTKTAHTGWQGGGGVISGGKNGVSCTETWELLEEVQPQLTQNHRAFSYYSAGQADEKANENRSSTKYGKEDRGKHERIMERKMKYEVKKDKNLPNEIVKM